MNPKRWALAALFVLGAHCSNSSTSPSFAGSGSGSAGGDDSSIGAGSGTSGGDDSGTSSSSGSTTAGTGSASASGSPGGGGGTDGPACVLGIQGLTYAGCQACAACEQMNCCALTNACLNDTACNGYSACQANCFNGQGPDGGMFNADDDATVPDPSGEGGVITLADLCAQNCLPPDAGAVWNDFQTCISPQCDNACLCP
jgi:hypothetical protein